ncbi:hypothetical protein TNCV_3821361 [Trichonephila clavipes]|nr:hypothetical protein TNCV_3821361 [Trichonephila clavipes]
MEKTADPKREVQVIHHYDHLVPSKAAIDDSLPGNILKFEKWKNIVLRNWIDKFTRMIVCSMETKNHHKTWHGKLRLVGENRDNSSRWEDDATI